MHSIVEFQVKFIIFKYNALCCNGHFFGNVHTLYILQSQVVLLHIEPNKDDSDLLLQSEELSVTEGSVFHKYVFHIVHACLYVCVNVHLRSSAMTSSACSIL